ncbi:MAG TPA: hypothetical protein PK014_05585 [Thermoanaerobaculia bacterium]|nr:hypothetical protein [Thermoanaerobaculia bacterium]HUM28704.1 hypothetical protein [Thermoanaerobaculia bacterium]HXK68047.1 hypothetical protein [Thermoanaerobaculia bacterium]
MKFIPRIVFWIGTIGFVYGVFLKVANQLGSPAAWPFGLIPRNFFQGSMGCFMFAIAYCVVFIFARKAED